SSPRLHACRHLFPTGRSSDVARPVKAHGRAGYTSARAGSLSVHGRLITVTGVSLRPGRKLSITYRAGAAPSRPRTWIFTASERRSDEHTSELHSTANLHSPPI